jgi:hypothetical protein
MKKNNLKNIDLKERELNLTKKKSNHNGWNWKIILIKKKN